MIYLVTATVETRHGKWRGSVQVPSFVLDGRALGIRNAEHAASIAREVITAGRPDVPTVHVCAVPRCPGCGHDGGDVQLYGRVICGHCHVDGPDAPRVMW